MLKPTMPSMATSMPPPMSIERVLSGFCMAMKTMTPVEPSIGTTIIRTLPIDAGSAFSGGIWIARVPEGCSGTAAVRRFLRVTIRSPRAVRVRVRCDCTQCSGVDFQVLTDG